MAEPAAPPPLAPDASAKFAEFARACKAAARAVALYPGSHPAIGVSLSRLTQATTRLADSGPFKVQVRADSLLLDGALPQRPDPAIGELAEVLYRHMIGVLTVNAAADADSWRTLLLLLARTPEDVRGDGGIARLWATAGGPSLEIIEIDYAEVLREKQGDAATIDQIIAAAIAGPQMQLDDSTLQALLGIVGDPEKLQQLMTELEAATEAGGLDVKTAAFLNLLRGLAEYVARTNPDQLDSIFKQVGHAAGGFSADSMIALLAQRERPEAMAGTINVVGALADRMSDATVAKFVAGSVIAEGGATDRLAHAFQALVPERDRQRQLLALAETEVSASTLGEDTSFKELWGSVEGMLTSYSDESYVSSDYGRELSGARARAVDVERVSDDPPERVAAWLTTVSDSALRNLDHQLLLDILAIEEDPLRWRDVAETVVTHADDLVRVGYFDPAWQLAEAVVDQAAARPGREVHARSALAHFGRGPMMKHVAAHLRGANDEGYDRFKRICQSPSRHPHRLRSPGSRIGPAADERAELGSAAYGRVPAARVRRHGGTQRNGAASNRQRAARPAGGGARAHDERQRRGGRDSVARAHEGRRPDARDTRQRAALGARRAGSGFLRLPGQAHATPRAATDLHGSRRSARLVRRGCCHRYVELRATSGRMVGASADASHTPDRCGSAAQDWHSRRPRSASRSSVCGPTRCTRGRTR